MSDEIFTGMDKPITCLENSDRRWTLQLGELYLPVVTAVPLQATILCLLAAVIPVASP